MTGHLDDEWYIVATLLPTQRKFTNSGQQSMDNVGHFVFGQRVEVATRSAAAAAGGGRSRPVLVAVANQRKRSLTVQGGDGLRRVDGCGPRWQASRFRPPFPAAHVERMADLADLIVHRCQIVFDFVQLIEEAGDLLLPVLHHGHGVVDGTLPTIGRRQRRRTRRRRSRRSAGRFRRHPARRSVGIRRRYPRSGHDGCRFRLWRTFFFRLSIQKTFIQSNLFIYRSTQRWFPTEKFNSF